VSPAQRAEATTASITGVFGMNFEFVPLLHAHWGVPAALAFMLAVSVGMIWFFRRKRWI
jgi:magnesium transporter